MWNLILPVFWWWFKSSWMHRIHLGESLIFLSIIANMIKIFKWIIVMLDVIFINLVDPVQWMLHLVRNIVLIIWRWRFKTCWSTWINLRQSLILLCVISNMIQVLQCIVMVLQIIFIDLVNTIQWMFQLVWNIILIIRRWWL